MMKKPVALTTLAVVILGLAVLSVYTQVQQQVAQPARSPRVKVPVPEKLQPRLDEVGFVVAPQVHQTELARMYRYWQSSHYPVVVTTDSALHTAHLFFDWYQRFLEIAHLRGDLVNLTDTLASKMAQYQDEAGDQETREVALMGACYFLVGKLEIGEDGRSLRAKRAMEDGYEVIEVPLPCLLTCIKELNTPRYPPISGIQHAVRVEIPVWSAADVDADPEKIGLKGSPTMVAKTFTPEPACRGDCVQGTCEDMVSQLIDKLHEINILKE